MEATTPQAGGTSHRVHILVKGEEEEERWAGTHQVLTNRGKEGRLVVGMQLGLQVQGVKVHGAMVVDMTNSGLVNSEESDSKMVYPMSIIVVIGIQMNDRNKVANRHNTGIHYQQTESYNTSSVLSLT